MAISLDYSALQPIAKQPRLNSNEIAMDSNLDTRRKRGGETRILPCEACQLPLDRGKHATPAFPN